MKKKPSAKTLINEALNKLQEITGLTVRSYTVYPGKASLSANITIKVKGGASEGRKAEALRDV